MNDLSLDVQGKRTILNPSQQEIRSAIESISPPDDPFLILQKGGDGWTYMQAILDDNSSWTVEYQDGSLEKHFQASNLSTEKVISMFLAYADGDEAWRDSVKWQPLRI